MATYGLKYHWEKTQKDGKIVRLELLCKNWLGNAYEIGAVTAFSLQIQGNQNNITSPIIKTSVQVSIKDMFDVGTTQGDGTTCVANGIKYGQWEEFFTNDATKFKVVVKSKASASASVWTTQWTGYLTPDSWGEEMIYRGTINLTARDMLGYLDEQEFDLTGRTTLRNLITSAITKSECGMTLDVHDAELLINNNTHNILDHSIACETFGGKSWYEALEQTIEAIGCVIRYVGGNTIVLTSIRHAADFSMSVAPAFTGRSGYRELDPAIKQIVEVFNPDIAEYETEYPSAQQYTQSSPAAYHRQEYTVGTQSTIMNSIRKRTLVQDSSLNGWRGTLAVPRNTAADASVPAQEFFIPTDTTDSDYVDYRNSAVAPPYKVTFQGILCGGEGTSAVASDAYTINKIKVQFLASVNGGTKYFADSYSWGDVAYTWEIGNGDSINIPVCADATEYFVRIVQITTECKVLPYNALVAALQVYFGNSDGVALAGEVKTTTVYNTDNHVEITRKPSIGSVTSNASPLVAQNVLAYGSAIADDAWKFPGDANTYPLAVMVHAQLLVFNASQLGNSIFTGSLVDSAGASLLPMSKYTYFGRNCILLAGSYNFCSGGIDSVTLREALSWNDIWTGGFNPIYTRKESKGEGGTGKSSGGGSSSGGGGGTQVAWGNEGTDNVQLSVGGVIKTLLTAHQTIVLESGTNNGTLKLTIGGGNPIDNIQVKGLAALAYKASLAASDIPSLNADKITSGQFSDARIASASIWNGKYEKPANGIPATDLASAVRTSLGKADTALQPDGATMTGLLQVATGVGIEDASGNGLLVYRPTEEWSGISSIQWGLGSTDSQGVLRSSNSHLIHYKGGSSYNILDASNYTDYAVDKMNSISFVANGSSYIMANFHDNNLSSLAASSYIECWDNPGWWNFHIGSLVAAGEVTAGSDLRWKDNITEYREGRDILKMLTPVEWDWKEGRGQGHSAGFIAQDILDILPYAVKGNEKDGLTLNYNVFHAVWAGCLQEHDAEIERLRKRVARLETDIRKLRNQQ